MSNETTERAPFLLRLRGRVGMWLITPHWRAFKHQCNTAWDNYDSGGNYGPNYWLIKGFALHHLRDALRSGQIHREWGSYVPMRDRPMATPNTDERCCADGFNCEDPGVSCNNDPEVEARYQARRKHVDSSEDGNA